MRSLTDKDVGKIYLFYRSLSASSGEDEFNRLLKLMFGKQHLSLEHLSEIETLNKALIPILLDTSLLYLYKFSDGGNTAFCKQVVVKCANATDPDDLFIFVSGLLHAGYLSLPSQVQLLRVMSEIVPLQALNIVERKTVTSGLVSAFAVQGQVSKVMENWLYYVRVLDKVFTRLEILILPPSNDSKLLGVISIGYMKGNIEKQLELKIKRRGGYLTLAEFAFLALLAQTSVSGKKNLSQVGHGFLLNLKTLWEVHERGKLFQFQKVSGPNAEFKRRIDSIKNKINAKVFRLIHKKSRGRERSNWTDVEKKFELIVDTKDGFAVTASKLISVKNIKYLDNVI